MAENRILLVEGIDDLHVLGHIFLNQNIEVVTENRVWKVEEEKRVGRITIREQEGVDKLKKRLSENISTIFWKICRSNLKEAKLPRWALLLMQTLT